MLEKMWNNLRKCCYAQLVVKQSLATEPDETEAIPNDVKRPEEYCCPCCGAGISRLSLIHGGMIGKKKNGMVKAAIRCVACGRQHVIQGITAFHRAVVLILLNQPRRRKGEKSALFRTGAWSLEMTKARRAAWNAEMIAAKKAGRKVNLPSMEKKMGFMFAGLKSAIVHHKL